MCGIAGVIELKKDSKPSPEGLRRMASVLTHRGPDEEGFYMNEQVGLAHRRLSIIDIASGKQPMLTTDKNIGVVFNGEIYNFPELRDDLEGKGYTFKNRSDTEVLLNLYSHYGLDCFRRINGMFACAFWDERDRKLVIARDRFGKKPVFYYQDSKRFIFASEIKSILSFGNTDRNINISALHDFLSNSYIVGEQSMIEGIKRLPPAHVLILKDGILSTQSYWELKFEPVLKPMDEEEILEDLEDLLLKAVKRRLMSDVSLGAFLSGGLDSSVIVALMSQLSDRPVKTFTIGFNEDDYSEIEDARVVAKHLGTDHTEEIIKPSALDLLEDIVWFCDEPFGDSSAIPTYYVCKAARKHVTVALSGDGGDEVFAGYTRYQGISDLQTMNKIPERIRRVLLQGMTAVMPFTWPGWNYLFAAGRSGAGDNPGNGHLGIYPYIQEKLYTPELKKQLIDCDPFLIANGIIKKVSHLDRVSQFQYLDTLQYLPADILTKVDRMSMANSLEVRSPFLDYMLVEYMATLPVSFKLQNNVSKIILRKLGKKFLPESILSKRKQGFAVPKDLWFQNELRALSEEILLERKTIERGLFREDTMRKMLKHHASGKRDYSNWIWCLIVLEIWLRLFVDQAINNYPRETAIQLH